MPENAETEPPEVTEAAEAAERSIALQKLADLTEELGLYDTPMGDDGLTDAERAEYAEKFLTGAGSKTLGGHPASCPFCGVPLGPHADWETYKCHRPGG